jgi:hypothetical protein
MTKYRSFNENFYLIIIWIFSVLIEHFQPNLQIKNPNNSDTINDPKDIVANICTYQIAINYRTQLYSYLNIILCDVKLLLV